MNLKQLRLDEEKKINSSNLNNQSISTNYTNNQVTTTNNVTYNYNSTTYSKVPVFKGTKDINEVDFAEKFTDTFPTYLSNCEVITIPKKVKRQINALPKSVWSKVDPNKNFAVEKCLDFVSNFTGTIFYEKNEDRWLNLHSTYLDDRYKRGNSNTMVYNHVINALTYSTNTTLPVIEIKKNQYGGDTYKSGEFSKSYRLTTSFQINKFEKYTLTCNDLILKRRKKHIGGLTLALNNKIAYNLLMIYYSLEIPKEEDILNKSKHLISIGHKTNKGKLLASLNKKRKESIPKYRKKSFVEDGIKQFNYLTQNGLLIPKIGNYKSGGRVVDSINLMPSWIRSLIKIDGEDIVEVDFRALHPNLAIKIHAGISKYITHKKVAETLEIDIVKVKKEHLSFFNKRVKGMRKSVLYKYYEKHEPELLKNIINDKKSSDYRHKITSMRMFKLEVQIMTEVITRLNNIGIYVLYIYDALGCKKSNQDTVQNIMNEVVLEFGIYTEASI
ncbi:MAG: hypothetical protein ACJAYP_000973 [Flavobacterium sp.]|jgi:hypothetical protein